MRGKWQVRFAIVAAACTVALLAACGAGQAAEVSRVGAETATPGTAAPAPAFEALAPAIEDAPVGPSSQSNPVDVPVTSNDVAIDPAPTPTRQPGPTVAPAGPGSTELPTPTPVSIALPDPGSDTEPTMPAPVPIAPDGVPDAASIPTSVPSATATPAPAPTPAPTSSPVPPSAPGLPVANVTRATQFVPLDQPRFVPASQAQGMTAESLVLGVDWAGEPRAYPLSMMWFHHIANDNIGGSPVLVTY